MPDPLVRAQAIHRGLASVADALHGAPMAIHTHTVISLVNRLGREVEELIKEMKP